MSVVSDASPLNYLILIGEAGTLPRMFGRVVIPAAVLHELTGEGAPQLVAEFLRSPPKWVEVRVVTGVRDSGPLGAGEREAIALAAELEVLLLADDCEARRVAHRSGVAVTGTLGVLERAASKGMLHLPETFARLQTTNFRLSEDLVEAALARDRARREQEAC